MSCSVTSTVTRPQGPAACGDDETSRVPYSSSASAPSTVTNRHKCPKRRNAVTETPFGPALQKHRRRKLGQKSLGEIELDVVPLQPRKHFDRHLGEDLAA